MLPSSHKPRRGSYFSNKQRACNQSVDADTLIVDSAINEATLYVQDSSDLTAFKGKNESVASAVHDSGRCTQDTNRSEVVHLTSCAAPQEGYLQTHDEEEDKEEEEEEEEEGEEEDEEEEDDDDDDDDAGSLVDFVVDDGEDGAEEEEEDDDEEEGGEEADDRVLSVHAMRRDMDGIDTSNIVTGKRTRRQTQFYETDVFTSPEYLRMLLCDVPASELQAALHDEKDKHEEHGDNISSRSGSEEEEDDGDTSWKQNDSDEGSSTSEDDDDDDDEEEEEEEDEKDSKEDKGTL